LRREIDEVSAAPPHPQDARIAQIEAQFRTLGSNIAKGNTCPSCRAADLTPVTAEPNGNCPLCLSTRMERRQWDNARCAVCRQGTLQPYRLTDDQMFCAVCCVSVLRDEHRRKLGGLIDDLWGICPHCEAVYDVVGGHRARLETIVADPFGTGATIRGKLCPFRNGVNSADAATSTQNATIAAHSSIMSMPQAADWLAPEPPMHLACGRRQQDRLGS
jgi:hypothetical protein